MYIAVILFLGVSLLLQLAWILSLDIAHRDLKPENILCEKVDEVRGFIGVLLW